MDVTLRTFLTAIAQGLENPTDRVRSIGTWCGTNPPAKFTIYVRRADGTEYEINIKEEKTV